MTPLTAVLSRFSNRRLARRTQPAAAWTADVLEARTLLSGGDGGESDGGNSDGDPRDATDPDDQLFEAIPLEVNSLAVDRIDSGDVDIYRVELEEGLRYGFDIDSETLVDDPGNLDSYIRLMDRTGRFITSSFDRRAPNEMTGFLDSYLEFVPRESGTYYLGVASERNSQFDPITGAEDRPHSDAGRYELGFTQIPPRPLQVTGAGQTVTYDADASNVGTPFSRISTSDPDFNSYAGGMLTVTQVGGSRQPGDAIFLGTSSSFDRNEDDRLVRRFGSGVYGRVIAESNSEITIRLSGFADGFNVDTIIRAIRFQTADAGPTRTLRVSVSDGEGLETQFLQRINVTGGESTPVLNRLPQVRTYRAPGAPVAVLGSVDVTDFDTPNFAGGSLQVRNLPGPRQLGDRLSVRQNDRIEITDDGNVLVGGAIFGRMTAATGARIDVTLLSGATPTRTSEFLRAVRFRTPDAGPDRAIRVQLDDGDGRAVRRSVRVRVVGGTSAPEIETPDSELTMLAGGRTGLGGRVGVSDADSENFAGGALSVFVQRDGRSPQDRLFLAGAGIAVATDGAVSVDGTVVGRLRSEPAHRLTVLLNEQATAETTARLFNGVRFETGRTAGLRTLSLGLNDGDGRVGVSQVQLSVRANPLADVSRDSVAFLTHDPRKVEELDGLFARTGGLFD